MTLSGSRLQGQLYTDILSQLEVEFPINGALLPAEQAGIQADLEKLATALSTATGPDVVNEIVDNSLVPPGTFAIPGHSVTGTSSVE